MDASAVKAATALPTETREMLERSFQNPHPTVRARGIEAAARLKTAAILPLIEPLLSDPDARVSGAAAASFDAVVSTSDPELPRAFASIQSPQHRIRVAERLSQESSSGGLALVGRLYEMEPAAEVRSGMIRAVASSANANAARVVVRALGDRDAEVRQAAEEIMRQNPEWLRTESANDALPSLDQAREHASADAQHMIATWSERIRAAQVRQKMRETGMASLLSLTTALRCASPVLRQAAAEACQRTRDTRATAALVQALSDKDAEARRAAAVALHDLGWKAETEEQYAAYMVALRRFNDVTELGATGVDSLLNVAESDHPELQAEAIECLARTHSIRAMPVLAALLESEQPLVRNAAARALKRLEWVPPTPEAAVAHAIALEDWAGAAAAGAPATDRLISALKAACGDEARCNAIAAALAGIDDPNAAEILIDLARDGEVAQAATAALRNILSQKCSQVGEETLRRLAEIPDATQFTFTIDPKYRRPIRTGFEILNLEELRAAAAAGLARRSCGEHGENP